MAELLQLSGTCDLILDDKSRLALPTRYRKLLEEAGGGGCLLTVSLYDKCLWLYPMSSWTTVLEGIRDLPSFANPRVRALQRTLLGSSVTFKPDGQGRFIVPKNLRDYALLTKNVTLVGLQNKFEVWDKEKYQERMAEDFAALGDLNALAEEIPNLETFKL